MPETCHRCLAAPVADAKAPILGMEARLAVMCAPCAARGPLTPDEALRWRDYEREDWAPHRPECFDAPIPGRQWFSGCEPGGDWDSELGRYTGTGPRVDPETGRCEGCGEYACPSCGRANCPDHEQGAAPCSTTSDTV